MSEQPRAALDVSPVGQIFMAMGESAEALKVALGHTGDGHFGWSTAIAEWGSHGYPVGDQSHLFCGCGALLYNGRTGDTAEPGLVKRECRCGRVVAAGADEPSPRCDVCGDGVARTLSNAGPFGDVQLPRRERVVAHCRHWADGEGCCRCGEPSWCPEGVTDGALARFEERRGSCPPTGP